MSHLGATATDRRRGRRVHGTRNCSRESRVLHIQIRNRTRGRTLGFYLYGACTVRVWPGPGGRDGGTDAELDYEYDLQSVHTLGRAYAMPTVLSERVGRSRP